MHAIYRIQNDPGKNNNTQPTIFRTFLNCRCSKHWMYDVVDVDSSGMHLQIMMNQIKWYLTYELLVSNAVLLRNCLNHVPSISIRKPKPSLPSTINRVKFFLFSFFFSGGGISSNVAFCSLSHTMSGWGVPCAMP